jgi:hypothetical protein
LRKSSAVLLIRLPSSCLLNDSKRTFGGDAQAGDRAMRNSCKECRKTAKSIFVTERTEGSSRSDSRSQVVFL